jgi:hypothetical protein
VVGRGYPSAIEAELEPFKRLVAEDVREGTPPAED